MTLDFKQLRRQAPGTRGVSGVPDSPDTTGVTDITDITDSRGTPGVADLPGLAEARGIPDIADLAEADQADTSEALERLGIEDALYDKLLTSSKNGIKFPWSDMSPNGPREKKKGGFQTPLRMNEYEHTLLHYLAGVEKTSVNKLILRLVKKAALREVRKRESRGTL